MEEDITPNIKFITIAVLASVQVNYLVRLCPCDAEHGAH